MAELVLANADLTVAFDAATGALVRLVANRTGWSLLGREDVARSYRLLVPIAEMRNHQVDGTQHALARSKRASTGDSLTLNWTRPVSPIAGELDLDIHVQVSLRGAALTFETEVTNRSPYVIEVVSYPMLGNITAGGRPIDRLGLSYVGGDRHPVFPTFAHQPGYWGVPYPIQTAAYPETPFVLLQTDGEGVYVGCHDTSVARTAQFVLELKPGASSSQGIGTEPFGLGLPEVPVAATIGAEPVRTELSVAHLPFLASGQRVRLSPVVVAPYVGSWHQGADQYREWRATWPRSIRPAWVDEPHAWQQIQLTSHQDERRYRYTDLVDIARECASNDVTALQITGWTLSGQDGRLPSHDTDDRLGSWADLREAITQVQRLGVKAVLYVKYTFADISTDEYRTGYHRWASEDEFGNPHVFAGYPYETLPQLLGIGTRRLAVMCTLSEEWLEICEREFTKVLDLGADGILYDESQHHWPARYCFSSRHGHPVPGHLYGADARLADRLRALSQGRSEFLLGGEACYDLQFRDYHLAYFRTAMDAIGIERYIAPFEPLMVAIPGYDDRNLVNACILRRYILSYEPRNFRGRLSEFPDTLEYGRRAEAFRRRHRERLWDAEYRDTRGGVVDVDGAAYPHFSVFAGTDEDTLVVANVHDHPIVVSPRLDGDHGDLRRFSPEEPEERRAAPVEEIPARSLLAFAAKRSRPDSPSR